MFSIREGREINEVDEGAVKRLARAKLLAYRPDDIRVLDGGIEKLSMRELAVLLHYGVEVYVEECRQVDPDLAALIEKGMVSAIREALSLPDQEQASMLARAVARARESVTTLIKSGKL
jgi:hypothetical protein